MSGRGRTLLASSTGLCFADLGLQYVTIIRETRGMPPPPQLHTQKSYSHIYDGPRLATNGSFSARATLFVLFVYFTWYKVRLAPFSHIDQGGITVIQSSYLMVSSGNNNFLTCTNGNRCIGNIKVLKFYLVVGTYVDEMGWDRERCKTRFI